MPTGDDLQTIAYWIVVPFALYAVNMDRRMKMQAVRPLRTPEAPGGGLALLAIAMTIWPGSVESHRILFFTATIGAAAWLWRALHLRETRMAAREASDLAHRKAPVLSNCDRLRSKISMLTDDLRLREGNILLESIGEEGDQEAAMDRQALIDSFRRDSRKRYQADIFHDLVGLARELEPFGVDEAAVRSLLAVKPSAPDDYDLIARKIEVLVQTIDAAA
ncbi:MAG TPA: hypothetical protein VGU66_05540 [Candidatus Elarobacter sp.]|nr:hypothetical protein [Candidatus Elarobacter sp.]